MRRSLRRRGQAALPTRRGVGIRGKLLMLLFASSLTSSVAYTAFAYEREKATVEDGIDARLLAGAEAAILVAGPAYQDRIRDAHSISAQEYDALLLKLSRFAREAGLEYVYTYMKFGDRIVTTASNATGDELRRGSYDRFFHHYDTAAPSLYEAFRTRKRVFENLSDGYGSFRTVSVPAVTPDGRVFVAGADIRIDFVDKQLAQALRSSVLIGAAIFIVMVAAGHWIISRIVRPLTALTGYTAHLVGGQVDSDVALRIGAVAASRRDEVGALAVALTDMIARIAVYIHELQESTAARERVEGEMAAAREIQMGLLPRSDPAFPMHSEFDLHGMMEPARAVGGDLYDYFIVAERYLVFIVGDVSGKGVPAALFMAVAKALFKGNSAAAGHGRPDVVRLVTLLNHQLCDQNPQELFMTVFAGFLDIRTGAVEYCDAGHDPPMLLSQEGGVRRIDKVAGMALGAISDFAYRPGHFVMRPGETLLLFTDGITEAMNDEESPLTLEGLTERLEVMPPSFSVREVNGWIRDEVSAFAKGAEQSDDLTLLAIRYLGNREY